MLKLFNSYFALIPIALISLLMIALRLNVIINGFTVNMWQGNLAPFSRFYVYVFGQNLVINPLFNSILSGIIIFVQSGIIISIFGFFRNKELKTFLPAWVFVILMHLNPIFIFVSPQLFSLLFILWAFKKTVNTGNEPKNKRLLFDIGILIGIATMFWSPSILYIIFVFIYLNYNNSLSFKTFLLIIISYIIPLIYVVAYYLFTKNKVYFVDIFNKISLNTFEFDFYNFSQILSTILALILAFVSIFYTIKYASKQLREIKNVFFLLWIFIFNTFLVFLFQNENSFSLIIFLLFPFSIFISIMFNKIKQVSLAEFVHLTLFLTVIINFLYFTSQFKII